MNKETNKAYVQYGDFHGTASADINDEFIGLDSIAETLGILPEGYTAISLKLYWGEYHKAMSYNPASATFYFAKEDDIGDTFEKRESAFRAAGGTIHVKRVTIDIDINEFFTWFKRFSILMQRRYLHEVIEAFIIDEDVYAERTGEE